MPAAAADQNIQTSVECDLKGCFVFDTLFDFKMNEVNLKSNP